jgi:hypothetical protein
VGGITQYFSAIQEICAQAITSEDSVLGSDHKVEARVVIVLIDDVFLWLADIEVVDRGVRPRDIREWKQVQIGEAGANLIGRRNHVDIGAGRVGCGIPTKRQARGGIENITRGVHGAVNRLGSKGVGVSGRRSSAAGEPGVRQAGRRG